MIRRLGALAGAVAATLAFAASAQAAPSTPILKPIPTYVCGSTLNISWTPSTPDPGGVIVQYRVDVGDLTNGTATWKWVAGTSTTIGPLITNHHYVVRVRALQWRNGVMSWSGTAPRTFYRACLYIPVEKLKQYVAYNPWPECIMCGRLDDMQLDDPVIYRMVATAQPPAADIFRGIQLEGDGSVAVM
jgi:Fibronectin type III domain